MLAPAVHIMHQVWKGMAWVADDIEEETEPEEPTRSYDGGETGGEAMSNSDSLSETTSNATKRLSTIPENSVSYGTVDEVDEVDEAGNGDRVSDGRGSAPPPKSSSIATSLEAAEDDVHL